MLWVDKHRPNSLDKLDIHPELSEQLKNIVSSGDFPHLMVYGPSGSGKKTRVMAVLRQLFGSGVEKLKVEQREMKVGSARNKAVEITTISSPFHLEMNPSEAGHHDRYVVMDILKEIASSVPIDGSATRGFKVVIISEADRLTREAQQALRRTMEKYATTCKLILVAEGVSKLIEPIRSRCLLIRVSAPSEDEIATVLQRVVKKEGLVLPPKLGAKIASASERNLRRAILMLETCKVQQYPFTEDQAVPSADWERFIAEIAREMVEEQSPRKILVIRGKLYELLANCIPPEVIMRRLCIELMRKLDQELKRSVVEAAAEFEHRMKLGSKPIFHLEAFVAKFMSLYKHFLMSTTFDE